MKPLKVIVRVMILTMLLGFTIWGTHKSSAQTWDYTTSIIAYSSDTGAPQGLDEIYLRNGDGSNALALTLNNAYDGEPSWSPDGEQIAFVSDRDGDLEIYAMNADGTNVRRLTTSPNLDFHPAWSPDGSAIAFTSFRDGNDEIYIMNIDGSSPVNITQNNSMDSSPTWSPDGMRIIFSSSRNGANNLYLMNRDGSNLEALLPSQYSQVGPAWSPDGSKIAFMSIQNVRIPNIFVLDLATMNVAQITNDTDGEGVFEPAWSPDGSMLAYARAHGPADIYFYQFSNGQEIRFTDFSANTGSPAWQPIQVTPTPTPTFTPTPAATPTPTQRVRYVRCYGMDFLPTVPRIDSQLQCVYQLWQIDPAQALAYGTTSLLQFDSNNRVLVDVTLVDAAAATTFSQTLPTLGGVAIAQFQAAVAAYIPINALPAAAALPGVLYIIGSTRPMTF